MFRKICCVTCARNQRHVLEFCGVQPHWVFCHILARTSLFFFFYAMHIWNLCWSGMWPTAHFTTENNGMCSTHDFQSYSDVEYMSENTWKCLGFLPCDKSHRCYITHHWQVVTAGYLQGSHLFQSSLQSCGNAICILKSDHSGFLQEEVATAPKYSMEAKRKLQWGNKCQSTKTYFLGGSECFSLINN